MTTSNDYIPSSRSSKAADNLPALPCPAPSEAAQVPAVPDSDVAPPLSKVRDDLLEAKRLGFEDQLVADYTGITLQEFNNYHNDDPSLARALRQAWAKGLAERVNTLKNAKQWQAQQLLINTFWSKAFALAKDAGTIDVGMVKSFREVAGKMTPNQIARAVEVMELGRVEDARRKELPAI
ncbi:MAG TPA: hypothetical protein VFC78_07405 [Tepidisphaeraceae bacterium]|nr:hypothetical protein [Tepidisphaeraceae bacterium]